MPATQTNKPHDTNENGFEPATPKAEPELLHSPKEDKDSAKPKSCTRKNELSVHRLKQIQSYNTLALCEDRERRLRVRKGERLSESPKKKTVSFPEKKETNHNL